MRGAGGAEVVGREVAKPGEAGTDELAEEPVVPGGCGTCVIVPLREMLSEVRSLRVLAMPELGGPIRPIVAPGKS